MRTRCAPASAAAGGRPRRTTQPQIELLEARELLSASPGRVTGFTLINAATDRAVIALKDGSTINLARLPNVKFNIRANTSPAAVGSVQFSLAGNTPHTENGAPYALFSDNAGDYKGQAFAVGSYTLTAVPFAGRNAGGVAGAGATIHFTVVRQPPPPIPTPTVVSLSLIDTTSNQTIAGLTDGANIDLGGLHASADHLNIRADTLPANTGSVQFVLDGMTHIENVAPYALFGNEGDVYLAGTLAPGQHTLTVTPFTRAGASGQAGASRTVAFSVVEPQAAGGLLFYIDQNRNNSIDEATEAIQPNQQFDFDVTQTEGHVLAEFKNTGPELTLDGTFVIGTYHPDAGETNPDVFDPDGNPRPAPDPGTPTFGLSPALPDHTLDAGFLDFNEPARPTHLDGTPNTDDLPDRFFREQGGVLIRADGSHVPFVLRAEVHDTPGTGEPNQTLPDLEYDFTFRAATGTTGNRPPLTLKTGDVLQFNYDAQTPGRSTNSAAPSSGGRTYITRPRVRVARG